MFVTNVQCPCSSVCFYQCPYIPLKHSLGEKPIRGKQHHVSKHCNYFEFILRILRISSDVDQAPKLHSSVLDELLPNFGLLLEGDDTKKDITKGNNPGNLWPIYFPINYQRYCTTGCFHRKGPTNFSASQKSCPNSTQCTPTDG